MLVEVRTEKNRSKSNYIRYLQRHNKIKTYYGKNDYICYDTDDVKNWKENAHRGRPPKKQ